MAMRECCMLILASLNSHPLRVSDGSHAVDEI